jgi:hypothetical protein
MGPILEFNVQRKDEICFFRVRIYEDYSDMCQGVDNWKRKGHYEEPNVLAVCMEEETVKDVCGCLLYGNLFMQRKALTYGLIAHESFHMALIHERSCIGYVGPYNTECENVEERLAYKLADFTRIIIDNIKKTDLRITNKA